MDLLFGQDYYLARFLLQRGLAFLYLIAFLVALNQFRGLLGEHGLLPIPQFLRAVSFNQAPSLFHFYFSDTFFAAIALTGIVLSLTVLVGANEKFPWWVTSAVFGVLWILYLSIVNVGQTFYAFGWESLLLEAGFLAIFLGSSKLAVPILIIFLLRWLVFRVEFGAGLIKLRGDECWRDLTCLYYHHETQPMPNPLSWYFHNLPLPLHKIEVLGNHFFQLVVPFGLFLPQPIASISAGLIIFSQLWLVLSGNFSWLNWIVIVLSISGFSNVYLNKIIPIKIPESFPVSFTQQGLVFIVTLLVVVLSIYPVRNMLSKRQMMNASFNPFHLVNTYGAFGTVTKKRYEIVIEGTRDSEIGPKTQWEEYEFKGKPSDPKRAPPQYAPYHLRLDWLMWFLPFNLAFDKDSRALGPYYQEQWFIRFVEKILKNDKETLKLLRKNPFTDSPPRFIRARVYLYKFTDIKERMETSAFWKREQIGEYLPATQLKDFSQQ